MNLTEQQIKKLRPLLAKLVSEVKQELRENAPNQELVRTVSEQCNFNVEETFDLFTAVLRNINERTLAKYMERLGNDLDRNGWKIEGTSFYKNAGY